MRGKRQKEKINEEMMKGARRWDSDGGEEKNWG